MFRGFLLTLRGTEKTAGSFTPTMSGTVFYSFWKITFSTLVLDLSMHLYFLCPSLLFYFFSLFLSIVTVKVKVSCTLCDQSTPPQEFRFCVHLKTFCTKGDITVTILSSLDLKYLCLYFDFSMSFYIKWMASYCARKKKKFTYSPR